MAPDYQGEGTAAIELERRLVGCHGAGHVDAPRDADVLPRTTQAGNDVWWPVPREPHLRQGGWLDSGGGSRASRHLVIVARVVRRGGDLQTRLWMACARCVPLVAPMALRSRPPAPLRTGQSSTEVADSTSGSPVATYGFTSNRRPDATR